MVGLPGIPLQFSLTSRIPVGWDRIDRVEFETGDLVFVRGRGRISRLICWFSRSVGEAPTFASHVGMVLDPERQSLIEALRTVVIRRIDSYRGEADVMVIRLPHGLLSSERVVMREQAIKYLKHRYGYLKIIVHALDHLLVKDRYVFRRLARLDDYPICSWLVAYVYKRVLNYRFGELPNLVSPDDMLDHCQVRDWHLVWADSYSTVRDFDIAT
ncbi:hypothetical protein LCGC14_0461480 [marine sediment metagenome]|uniref:Uncharacterized protein n=1 Tax=marine sediment metagenome TaxID=412755 RepID=A0A0F9SEW6_9ZZZZ